MFSIALITLSTVNAVSADSSIIYVSDSGGNDNWDGQYAEWQSGTLSGPKKSIKNATGTVTEGGIVTIANGVYTEAGNINITISKNMTITGQNKYKTIINGTDTNWIFKIVSGVNVTIQNLTLTNGNASYGGAIYNNGTLTVSDCIFTNNKATALGGAISNYNGTISSLKGCIFTNNSAGFGGAIDNNYRTIGTVIDCNFTGNTAIYGGAVSNWEGNITTLSGGMFSNNAASKSGGAVSNYKGIITNVNGCNFTGNNATEYGGAILNYGTITSLSGCKFMGNNATDSGGAIYNNGTINMHFNMFANNNATNGSAIYCSDGSMDVENNWWGSNDGPYGKISGFAVSKWLVLTVNANPATIKGDGVSIITADLLHDNQGNYHDSTLGHVPDGIKVNFRTNLGSIIGSPSLFNGIIQSNLNAGSINGIANVSATIDSQTVNTLVKIDTVLPTVITINPANNAKTNLTNKVITITFSEPIKAGSTYNSISVMGPSGVVSVTKNIKGNVLTLSLGSNCINGNYNINIPLNAVTDLAGNSLTLFTSRFTIDTVPPAVTATPNSGLSNNTIAVNLLSESNATIYYRINSGSWHTFTGSGKVLINSVGTNKLEFYAVDAAGNPSTHKICNYTIDKTAPTAWSNYKSGLYNVTKTITLNMSEAGNIYYTTNGSTPTTASTLYKGPLTVASTTTLKFIAVDKAGNKSPIYTQIYKIDKTAPKVISTNPKTGATGFSRTATISIKFSENIKASSYWSKIYIKNLTTGKIATISKSISGNTLYIKMTLKRYAYNWYQVYIPAAAVKDSANNNLTTVYKLNFKTGKY